MMQSHFNEQMKMAGVTQSDGDPVIACQVNIDKNFAFLEVGGVIIGLGMNIENRVGVVEVGKDSLFLVNVS